MITSAMRMYSALALGGNEMCAFDMSYIVVGKK